MTIHEFTTELFVRVDDAMTHQEKHPQALLYPSETVALGMLFALKGVGTRAFYRWAKANLAPLFPHLPERTRVFRLLAAHRDWTEHFLVQPSLLGVVDSFGVGAKLCFVLDHLGRVVDWAVDTANVYDATFHPLIKKYDGQMLILGDSGFHVKTTSEQCDPENLKVCKRGVWNERMLIGTVLSMLTHTCHIKKVGHRVWSGLKARLAFALAAFNVCCHWNGPKADENGSVSLSLLQVAL